MTNNKGNALVELMMVSMLLLLFGATIFTLIATGSDTQQRILNNKDAQADARVAMSYVNVRIRQNDNAYKISVKPCDIDGKNAIAIEKSTESGLSYCDWIYFDAAEKCLKEATTYDGETLTQEMGFSIAPIEDFTIEFSEENNTITATAFYAYEAGAADENSSCKKLSSTIVLRSESNLEQIALRP